ncbi:MAG: amidohydrolase family protein [Phycisphaerales bacterium]|nr:amidohydrolase family protein [Phycisphaerales bacterium]
MGVALTVSSAQARIDDEKIVVIKAGHIITVTGEEIDGGDIIIRDGKVELVGKRLEYPAGATVIDASDQTVMPGLLNAFSRFGLPNYNRSGVHGNYTGADHVILSEIDFEPLVSNGYTAVAWCPPGGGIPGVASVYRTAGADDQRVLDAQNYLVVWMTDPSGDKGTLRGALKQAQAEIDKVEKARKEWDEKQKKEAEEAKKKAEEEKGEKKEGDKPQPPQPKPGEGTPGEAKTAEGGKSEPPKEEKPKEFEPPKIDPAHQPLVDLIQKKAGVKALIILGSASDYLHAQDVLKDHKELAHNYYLRLGISTDFHLIAEQLGEKKAFVLAHGLIGRLPQTVNRNNPVALLIEKGCEIALTPGSDSTFELEQYRTRLADQVRSGLSRADAIKAITINPWKFIGMERKFGSIEKGKTADLIFLDGDVLDPAARVQRVMVGGEVVWERDERQANR